MCFTFSHGQSSYLLNCLSHLIAVVKWCKNKSDTSRFQTVDIHSLETFKETPVIFFEFLNYIYSLAPITQIFCDIEHVPLTFIRSFIRSFIHSFIFICSYISLIIYSFIIFSHSSTEIFT